MRVGIDLVPVDVVRESIATHGTRYLERVYSPREISDCRRGGEIDPERLAARFAAKEAAFKALRVGDSPVGWRDVEVRRDPDGWVDLLLTGGAATLAEQAGITGLAVSLSHERGVATAVVVAAMVRSGTRVEA
jgi:holo-[acyl-carrier protein] synthase